MSQQQETERVRGIFDASVAHYDKAIAISEKLLIMRRQKNGAV